MVTYYELDTLRRSLNIAANDNADDAWLKITGTRADGIINNKLNTYMTTPLSAPVDPTIVQASNALVLAYYYKRNDPTDPRAQDMFTMAYGLINDYINTLKKTKSAAKVPQYFVTTTGNFNNTNKTVS